MAHVKKIRALVTVCMFWSFLVRYSLRWYLLLSSLWFLALKVDMVKVVSELSEKCI